MTQSAAPPAADRPAHYRLGDETWALILKEYREGATAPSLEKKWRVSQSAIRRRATKHKSTKRDWGDEQAIDRALARETELEEARRNSPEAVAGRLFDGIELNEAEAGDPAVLMRAATLASGRAMQGRLWTEAKALAGLAESYARLGAREARSGGGGTIETVDLQLLFDILFDDKHRVVERFAVDPDNIEGDPDAALKRAFWERRAAGYRDMRDREEQQMRRAFAAERRLRELGEAPPEMDDEMRAAWREGLRRASITEAEIEDICGPTGGEDGR